MTPAALAQFYPLFLDSAPVVAASILGASVVFSLAAKPVRQLRRARRVRQWAEGQRDIDALRCMSWQNFEVFAGDAFRRCGYRVEETGGGGSDNGVDLLLHKQGRRIVVQCKHYKARVGAPIVREAVGVAVHYKARGVYVVALGGFTKAAHAYAKGKSIRLIDGPAMLEIINKKRGA